MSAGAGPVHPAQVVVPRWLAVVGAWAWRLVAAAAALYVVARVLQGLEVVVIPVVVAVLASTVFTPPASMLRRLGLRPALATLVVFLGSLAVLGLLVWWIAPQFVGEASTVGSSLGAGLDRVESWLVDGPLGLSAGQVADYRGKLGAQLTSGHTGVVARLVQGAETALDVTVGVVLTVVLTFFFVKDGHRIVGHVVGRADPTGERRLEALAGDLWFTLGGYVRGSALNGLVNATVLGVGLVLLGVPLVLPLAVLTFFAAFAPLVGAFLAGGAAALVALADGGLGVALAVVALTIVIHHIEGYLVGPVVLGRAVHLPPAVILLSLSTGSVVAGVWGVLLAVPTVACGVAIERWATAPRDGPAAPAS